MAIHELAFKPKVVTDLTGQWDAVVVVAKDPKDIPDSLAYLKAPLELQSSVSPPPGARE